MVIVLKKKKKKARKKEHKSKIKTGDEDNKYYRVLRKIYK